jgi:hypothetical protein
MIRQSSGTVLLLAMVATLVTAVAACGGDEAGSTAAAYEKTWKVAPAGDCACADGSEFAFWERRADPTKVVVFLDGGGACFDAETCAFTALGNPGDR